ncbi:DUF4258 domain-containing protein [Marinospirillum sp.]|uniref:DUF4258 domain-containing protein n=1 Tax=Marinospirillum sp. TaxID=2183934 RepID=UPI00384BDCA3
MSDLYIKIKNLVGSGEVRISEHGYDELAEDELGVGQILKDVPNALVVEEYPDFPKGASILLLQRDESDLPVHVVWGIPKGYAKPAVLVTAYRPDPRRWSDDFLERLK